MTSAELRQFARLGAEARLRELQREIEAIHRTFPDLRSGVASGGASLSSAQRNRPRGGMSKAQRKTVSDRMKKYWASRSGQDGKSGSRAETSQVSRGRRKMSAGARKRIGDAQRKRWAELKAEQRKTAEAGASVQSPAAGGSRKKK